ncbi:MAG: hypothetical protein QM400_08470, partial [Spirochaetota bacterium]|nr:hypothetical protein [Spirochaetota bacterium]
CISLIPYKNLRINLVDIALYRRLVSAAGLLLLDEPSLGLAPILINKIFDMIDMIQKIHQEEK